MLIQINTDNHITAKDETASFFEKKIEEKLDRFDDQITRVEVHLSDENSGNKGGDDMRCMIEVRPKGLDPIAVSHQAETLDTAVNGAAEKMKRYLQNTFGKLER